MKTKIIFALLLTILVSSCSLQPAFAAPSTPVPELALWQSNMTTYGQSHCAELIDTTLSPDDLLRAVYYDAEWVYYQIADYTKDPKWNTCAQNAEVIYRDKYLVANNGQVPGYWVFPHGLKEDFIRTSDIKSKDAYKLLVQNASFVSSSPWADANQSDWSYMRETAYGIHAHLVSPNFGIAINIPRIEQLKGFAFSQLDQSFVSFTAQYRKPFMIGVLAHALIAYYEQVNPDPAIVTRLKLAADYMWTNMWNATSAGFKYTDDTRPSTITDATGKVICTEGTDPCGQGQEISPDLNMLIAPMYAWLYSITNDDKYILEGDAIWSGGVKNGYVQGAKQFNQSYRWSFQYLKYRNGSVVASPTPTVAATPIPTVIVTPPLTPIPTPTISLTPTKSPTATPTPVYTPIKTPTKSPTPSLTPTPCPTSATLAGMNCRLKKLEACLPTCK